MKEGELKNKALLNKLFKKLFVEKLGNLINNMGYLPRWIIFLIDFSVILVTFSATKLLIDGIGQSYINPNYNLLGVGCYFVLNILLFRVFRLYSGIIRHSSYIDAINIFASQFLWLIVSLALNFAFEEYLMKQDQKIYLTTGLLFNFILSFTSLFLYRVFVKKVFDIYSIELRNKSLIKAYILGTDNNAIAVANALNSEVPARFKIIGFIDRYASNTNKRILDLPIISLTRKVSVFMRAKGAQALILADKTLSKDEKLAIVDGCLEFNYKIYNVPIIADLEDSKKISQKVTNFKIQDLLERKPIVLDNHSISEQLTHKSILVTGAAGSIGSEIVWQVLNFNPKRVILVDIAESPLHQLKLELSKMSFPAEIISKVADVRDARMMEILFKEYRPQVVYHAAAYKHVPLMEENPAQAIFANVLGTKHVADLAYKYNSDSFVMVSTDKAVNPSNVMGASKRIAEKYVQVLQKRIDENKVSSKTKYITTRFGNVLGSNGSVVPLFTKQIAEGGPITITHPDIIRYFMTIPEACQLVLEAGAMGNGGEIYIFDMGKPVKIIDLARKMIKLAGYTPDKDIEIKIVGLRPGEKLYEELLNDASKTLPTHNHQIMIAQDKCECDNLLNMEVEALIEIARTYDNKAIVAQMKKIVPEFISMNSEYEVLDIKNVINE